MELGADSTLFLHLEDIKNKESYLVSKGGTDSIVL